MAALQNTLLFLASVYELLTYEIIDRVAGLNGLLEALKRSPTRNPRTTVALSDVCRAVDTAACLYFKPVRCLQRSVATVRILRRHGLPAELVIGYRPVPFLSHAWVEVHGTVVNDSPVYKDQLNVLMRT